MFDGETSPSPFLDFDFSRVGVAEERRDLADLVSLFLLVRSLFPPFDFLSFSDFSLSFFDDLALLADFEALSPGITFFTNLNYLT